MQAAAQGVEMVAELLKAARVDQAAAATAAAQMGMQELRELQIEAAGVEQVDINHLRIIKAKPVVQVLSSSRFLTPIPQPSQVG